MYNFDLPVVEFTEEQNNFLDKKYGRFYRKKKIKVHMKQGVILGSTGYPVFPKTR